MNYRYEWTVGKILEDAVDLAFEDIIMRNRLMMGHDDVDDVKDFYKNNIGVVVYDSRDEIVGLISFQSISNSTLSMHPILGRSISMGNKLQVCRQIISSILLSDKVTNLVTFIPHKLKPNLFFARKLGLEYNSTIKGFYLVDGKPVDALIYYTRRGKWAGHVHWIK